LAFGGVDVYSMSVKTFEKIQLWYPDQCVVSLHGRRKSATLPHSSTRETGYKNVRGGRTAGKKNPRKMKIITRKGPDGRVESRYTAQACRECDEKAGKKERRQRVKTKPR